MLAGWKTVTGLIISAIGQVLGMYGASGESVTGLMGAANDSIAAGLGFAGLLIALYGRWKAVTPMLQRKA
jgi:hypothetical protein